MSFAKKDPCRHPELCPWKVQPVVGMWAKVDGIEFWGTNCLLYTKCPDPRWRANHATDGPEDKGELK